MKILIDAMGGDHAPEAPVLGALQAAKDASWSNASSNAIHFFIEFPSFSNIKIVGTMICPDDYSIFYESLQPRAESAFQIEIHFGDDSSTTRAEIGAFLCILGMLPAAGALCTGSFGNFNSQTLEVFFLLLEPFE